MGEDSVVAARYCFQPFLTFPISRFFQGDFFPPDEAAAGYDERDSWIA